VTLSYISVDMKVWSLTYVVSVQSASIHYKNWNLINWYTRTTNSFAVVCVVKILDTNVTLCDTLRYVPQIRQLIDLKWRYRNLAKDCETLFSEISEVPELTVSCYFYESCVLVHGYVCFYIACENASFFQLHRGGRLWAPCSLSVCLRVRLWIW